MLYSFFKFIIKRPLLTLFIITLFVLGLGTYATKLEIDASAETLLLEDDQDLQFARKMSERYQSPDFLVVTFTPPKDLLSHESLNHIAKLSKELEALPSISSVTSILNAPLLQSPILPVKELVKEVPTLQSPKVDITLAKQEFLTSPLYKNNLVSSDFKTTALVLKLTPDEHYKELLEARNALIEKKRTAPLTTKEKEHLQKIQIDFKAHRDAQRSLEHYNIQKIRAIIQHDKGDAKIFLGGVAMIADDMVTYVKSDVAVYGTTLLGLLILTLWVIFKQLRWISIPIVICIYSVVATTGTLGFFGWEVTVISSNFVSLQLILTISIILHLVVRYRELAQMYTKTNANRLILTTLLSKANPSFFAIITTIAGFGSLVLSGIKPIINLGWMMSVGIGFSLIIAFCLFGAIMALLPRLTPTTSFERFFGLTRLCASAVENHGSKILIGSILIFLMGISGAALLKVENSFINYFKSTTEIYQGMAVIDRDLGGTTPLDIIVTFPQNEDEKLETTGDEEFDDFEAEFEEEKNDAQYWFDPTKMEQILAIHDYLESRPEIGAVQSLGTTLKIGAILNEGEQLDNFQIALLYNELPEKFKEIILTPYINIQNNQVRFSTRIIDSNPELRRDALLKEIDADLEKMLASKGIDHQLSGLMVLYNNMLQSLFDSQILTLGAVVLVLITMFWLLFGSFKIALIAIASNLVPMSIIFGFMGWIGIPLDMMTITIAAISIGIGVDDTIHYIHRFREELAHDGNYINAMKRSHNSIGYAMYYTSFAIILGFSVLVISNFIPTIYFGLLTVLVMFMVLMGALLLLPKLLIKYRPF